MMLTFDWASDDLFSHKQQVNCCKEDSAPLQLCILQAIGAWISFVVQSLSLHMIGHQIQISINYSQRNAFRKHVGVCLLS